MIISGAALTNCSIEMILRRRAGWDMGKRGSPHGVDGGMVGGHWWTSRVIWLLSTTLLVFAPLISFKRVDSLRYTSALSVGLAMVFVMISAGISIVRLWNVSVSIPRLMPVLVDQTSFWKLFTTIPVLVTAYICHHNVNPIENELADPTQMKSIGCSWNLHKARQISLIAYDFVGCIIQHSSRIQRYLRHFHHRWHLKLISKEMHAFWLHWHRLCSSFGDADSRCKMTRQRTLGWSALTKNLSQNCCPEHQNIRSLATDAGNDTEGLI